MCAMYHCMCSAYMTVHVYDSAHIFLSADTGGKSLPEQRNRWVWDSSNPGHQLEPCKFGGA